MAFQYIASTFIKAYTPTDKHIYFVDKDGFDKGSVKANRVINTSVSTVYLNIKINNEEKINYKRLEFANNSEAKLAQINLQTALETLNYSAETIEGAPITTIDAVNVTYNTNPDFATVAEALDFLLYKYPEIPTFTINSPTVLDKGNVKNGITFNWTLNKSMVSLNISPTIGAIVPPSLLTYTNNILNISSNTTFTLTANDGTNSTTKTASVLFKSRLYYGVNPNPTLTNGQILALSNEFIDNRFNEKVLDATGGNYLYFCYPVAFGNATFLVNGFETVFNKTTITLINNYGFSENYNIYRSIYIQNGNAINVKIQ